MGQYDEWYLVCVSREKPDGPGQIVGPFHDRDVAVEDARREEEVGNCTKKHLIGRGPIPDSAEVNTSYILSTQPEVWQFYERNLDRCPPRFRGFFEPGVAPRCHSAPF